MSREMRAHRAVSPFKLVRLGGGMALIFALVGCGFINPGGKEEEEESPFGPTGIPPHLRSRSAQADGTAVAPGGNRAALPANFQIPDEEDLVFTDPDNPDAEIPELSALLAEQGPKRGPWEQSDTLARQRAMREGKGMLIWFTDSARSPMCKALEQELFSTPEFNEWADERVVRLRIDANISAAARDTDLSLDETDTLRINLRNYSESMRKRYRVLGSPAVVMLDAEGRVLTRYRGYKRGEGELFFGKLKHSETVIARNNAAWRKSMEGRGYREWRDARGRTTIFARLVAYQDGELVLVEPDGNRAKTRASNLSAEDRKWIEEEKRRRGM